MPTTPRLIVRRDLAVVALIALNIWASVPAAAPVLASASTCESVIASPVFQYLHRIATGSYVTDPGALESACTVEDHPAQSTLKRVVVTIVGEGDLRVTAVAAYDTQTQSVGSAVIDDTRDKPRPISIEHTLHFANHRALLHSDPYMPEVTVASSMAGTYDPGVGAITGFPLPPATGGYDACVWITERAFNAGCSAFETDCAERAEQAAGAVCAWIED